MQVLCIDTSRKEALIALVYEDKEYILKMPESMKHSESLLNYIEKALTDKGIDVSELDAVGSIVGPGSFTGIRVGMSVVKAMTFALNKKIASANMFEVVSSKVKDGYFILNSTLTTIYYGKLQKGKLIDSGYIKKDEFSNLISGDKVYALIQEQDSVKVAYNDIEYIDDIDMLIVNTIRDKVKAQKFTTDTDYAPMYIQLSQAEENLKAKGV